jgi:hypothetical protein
MNRFYNKNGPILQRILKVERFPTIKVDWFYKCTLCLSVHIKSGLFISRFKSFKAVENIKKKGEVSEGSF